MMPAIGSRMRRWRGRTRPVEAGAGAAAAFAVLAVLLAATCLPRASAPGEPPPPPGENVFVVRVVDGDTIVTRAAGGAEERVRLLLVDTPETHPEAECYGPEASDFARGLMPRGSAVRLERDVTNRDRHGRLLRYVWLPDGTLLSERLAEAGMARHVVYRGVDVRYRAHIAAAEQRARLAGAGLWGACP